MAPTFLALDEILEIHKDQIGRYGGRPGIRDIRLLQSALAQPQATFGGQFLHTDLFEMAAAYLFHIVRNHPFTDGNKRVGVVAALVFLEMNDCEVELTNPVLESVVLAAAQGQIEKAALAQFLRVHAV